MKSLLLAITLTACIDEDHLELVPARSTTQAIGDGLLNVFDVKRVHCEGGNTHGNCETSWPTITNVYTDDYVEVTWFADHRFYVSNLTSYGSGTVYVHTKEGVSDSFEMDIERVRYSSIGWMNRDLSFGPFKNGAPSERDEAAFTNSTIELSQAHYSVPFDVLADSSSGLSNDYLLTGYTDYALEGGVMHASLVPMPGWDASTSELHFPRMLLQTRDVPGTVSVSTAVGGKLTVDVVDANAIASLGMFTGRPLDENSFYLDEFRIQPRDANGRLIAGCPAAGPTVTDDKGLFVASRVTLDREQFCVLRFERVDGRPLESTTLVIRWGNAELRVPFVPR